MATKKVRSSSEKQLKATIRKLEARLERADAKAARWKQKAKRSEAGAATLKARAAKLDNKLAKAKKAAREPAPIGGREQASHDTPTPPESVDSTDQAASTPDASWTVLQLRSEARSRGLTGLSGKSKAELIAALA